jgi:hypothetical protein
MGVLVSVTVRSYNSSGGNLPAQQSHNVHVPATDNAHLVLSFTFPLCPSFRRKFATNADR